MKINNNLKFNFEKIYESDRYPFILWISECADEDNELVSRYHLIYNRNEEKIVGYIESSKPNNGNASALISHTVCELEKLVNEIGNFKHVIKIEGDIGKLVNIYKRNNYEEKLINIKKNDKIIIRRCLVREYK